MEKKKRHSILKRAMAVALSLMLAFTGFQLTGLRAKAANFNTEDCIKDILIYPSGCLKSMRLTISTTDSDLAPAFGKIAVHKKQLAYNYLHPYKPKGSNWGNVDNDYLKNNDGLLAWSLGDEFKWTEWKSNNPGIVDVNFSDNQINLYNAGNYYIYLWTRSENYGIYSDYLLGTLNSSDGKLKLGEQAIKSIQKAEITTVPEAKTDLKYTGQPLPLVTEGQVKAPDGSEIHYSTDEQKTWSNKVPTASTPGTYKVYYKPVGKSESGNFSEGTVGGPITVTIAPMPVTVTPKAGQQKQYGEPDPTFEYEVAGVSEVDLGTSFTGALSREKLGTDNVGEYKITQGTLSSENYAITFTPDVIFTIVPRSAPSKNSIPDGEKPTASNPRYSAGSPVALITAPSIFPFETMNGYTIQYSLDKNNDGGWTTDISTIKASEIGTHTVYYRYVNNDSNHAPMLVDAIFELTSKVRGAATVTDSNGNNVTEYGTFAEAAAAWGKNGGKLTLLEDVSAASTINLKNPDNTLDLNGHTLTGPLTGDLFNLEAGDSAAPNTLTIEDGASSGGGEIVNNGTGDLIEAGSNTKVTIKSGKISNSNGNVVNGGENSGVKVDINGGTVNNTTGNIVKAGSGAEINITAGTVTNSGGDITNIGENSRVTISGGDVTNNIGGSIVNAGTNTGVTVSLTGGNITNSGDYAVKTGGNGNVTVSGNADITNTNNGGINVGTGSSVAVSGGEISAAGGNIINAGDNAEVDITGGTLSNTNGGGVSIGGVSVGGGTSTVDISGNSTSLSTSGDAVSVTGAGAAITQTGGSVESTGGKAYNVEEDTPVKILGGSVKTADDKNAIDNGNITLGGNIDIDGGGIYLPKDKQIQLEKEKGFNPQSPINLSVEDNYVGTFLDNNSADFFNKSIDDLEKAFAAGEDGKGLGFDTYGKPVLNDCDTYGGITLDGRPLNNTNIARLLNITPGNVTYDSGTKTLTINENVTILAGKTLDIPAGVTIVIPSGKIQVEGTLVNNGALGVADTEISSGGALTNKGNGSVSGSVTNGGGTITNAGTISGIVNNNSGTLKNTGTLSGNVNNSNGATLNNDTGGNITGGVDNSGIFNNGGTVKGTGTVKNSGSGAVLTNTGDIEGNVNVDNENDGKIVNDGSINTSGTVKNGTGSTIENNAGKTIGSAVTNDGTIENAGTLSGNVSNNGTINNTGKLSGNTTNNASGTINNNSGGDIPGKLKNEDGGTVKNNNGATISGELENAGTLDNDGTISGAKVSNSGTLTNDGSITGSGTVKNSGNLTNNGTLDNTGGVNNTGTLTNNAGKIIAAPVNNSGSGTVENNGTLAGAVTNSGEGSTINNKPTGVIEGSLTNSDKGVINNEGIISGDITNSGNGSTINNKPNAEISGKLTNSDKGIINNKGTISGDLTSSGAGSNVNNALGGKLTGNVTNNTGSTFTNNGEINGDGKTFDNSGTLNNDAGKTISVPVKNTNGGIVNNNGTLSGKVTNGNGGIINNKAGITGAVTNQTGAVIDNKSGGAISGAIENEGVIIKDGGSTSGTVTNKGTAAVITPASGNVTVSDGKITMPANTRIETPASGVGTNTVTLPTIGDATFTVPFAEVNKLSVDADGTTTLPAGSSISKASTVTELPYGGSIKQDGTITVNKAPTTPTTPPSGGGGGSTDGGGSTGGGNGGSSGGTESYTIPVINENTVNVKTEITDGTAVVGDIAAEDIEKVTAKDGDSPDTTQNTTIEIDVSGAQQKVDSVQLTKDTVDRLAETAADNGNGVDTVTIRLTNARVELDAATLQAVSEEAEGNDIRLVVDDMYKKSSLNTVQRKAIQSYEDVSTFEAYFESNGRRIHDFKGGTARVSVKYDLPSGKLARFVHMLYLNPTGAVERFVTTCADGWVTGRLNHFSEYAIVYDTAESNATGEAEDKEKEPEPDPEPDPVETVIMYRIYNPNSGEHFYTANEEERDNIVEAGWNYEGIGWIAPIISDTPVYRLYNANVGDHLYTTSIRERDNLIKAGWRDEGIGWYSDDEKTVPLYRQYNPNAITGTHNYTAYKEENDWLVGLGWRAEGIGWYGMDEEKAMELMKQAS